MAKEAVMKITAAEKEAAAIRARAAAEAKQRVRDAEARGNAQCEKAEADALRVNREKLALTREKADELLRVSRERAEADAAAMMALSEKKMPEAVKMIVEGVWEQCR